MYYFYPSSNKLSAKAYSIVLIASLVISTLLLGGCFPDNITQVSNQSALARQHYLSAKNDLSLNDLSSALTNINKAITLQPNYYYYHLRQRIYKNLMLWSNCAKDGQTLIQLEPGYFQSYLLTADCNHKMGRYQEAIDAYNWFLSEQGLKRADLFFKRGASYSSLGERGKATLDWEYACKLDISYCNLSDQLNK